MGGRTAQRLAFHVLRASPEDALALADAIREVKERIGLCEVCFNLAEGPRCAICADARRDDHLICVVAEPGDVIAGLDRGGSRHRVILPAPTGAPMRASRSRHAWAVAACAAATRAMGTRKGEHET